jgi:hypothetical protein
VRIAITLLLALVLGACNGSLDAGGSGVDAGADDDPLAVPEDTEPGTLDDLHRTIIAERCSGQPGLCHNGQFEPNLSTPALTYAYMVNRPALEDPAALRVEPGNPDASFLVDKLRDRNVSTQMPLGADPLSEDEIAAIEAWIQAGALREPGAEPAPVLNNPPHEPEIGIYDLGGDRLDSPGGYSVPVGSTIVIRHSVRDFETSDPDMAFAVVVLTTAQGDLVLRPSEQQDPHLAPTSYELTAPMGATDLLNYRFQFTIPSTVTLYDDATGNLTDVPAAGLSVTPAALYLDELPPDGILAFSFGSPFTLE